MIADKTSSQELESFGTPTKQVVGGMSMKNLSKIINIVTTQLYSNPIGSIVRELTSNCFDAHIKFEKNERERLNNPLYIYEESVIVQYSEEEGQGFVSFIDVGTGLSPSQMEEIYINIGESDKENDNDALGYYGLGSKSFLSYTPSVDVVTIVDGIKYNYIVFKNQDGLLTYDLLFQENTEEHSGTTVKLCIGNIKHQKIDYYTADMFGTPQGYANKAEDYNKFRKEVINQLYYFDSVYTQGFDLENDYRLYEAKYFKVRTGDNPFKRMHIILGKVAYPIDWEIIGREPIDIPVGIIFQIGELFVPPSREGVTYDNVEKVKLINQRIDLVLDEIKERYNNNSSQVDTLEEYLKHKEAPNKTLFIQDVEIKIPRKQVLNKKQTGYINIDVIEDLIDVKWKSLAHLPIEIPTDPYFFFNIKGQLSSLDGKGNCKLLGLDEKAYKNIFNTVQKYKKNIYRIKGERTKSQDAFLVWKDKPIYPVLLGRDKSNFFTFEKELELGKLVSKQTTDNNGLLGKKKIYSPILIPITINGKTEWWNKTKIIQEYKRVITKDLIARTSSYEKESITAQYLADLQLQKLAKKRPKLEGIITVYDLVNDSPSTSSQLNLSRLEFFKGFIIYGEREKLDQLQGVKIMLTNKAPELSPRKEVLRYTGRTKITSQFYKDKPIWVNNYGWKILGNKDLSRTHRYNYREARLRPDVGRIFITAKSNHKLLQNNPYFMYVDEFLSNNNRMFRNAVTSWYLDKQLSRLTNKHSNLVSNLEKINSYLHSSYKELESWTNKNYKHFYNADDFLKTCYEVAKEKGMLWNDKIEELEKIEKWFTDDLKIFQLLDSNAFDDEDIFKDVILLLKTKHKRLSAEHYFIPSVEEEAIIEQAKEEVTYQLLLEPMKQKLLIYNPNQQQVA